MRRSKDEEELRSGAAFLLLSLIIFTFGAFIFFNRPRASQPKPAPAPKQKPRVGVGDQLLGVMLRTDEGRIVIDEALKGGNAIKAGLKAGDAILAIDGVKVAAVKGSIEETYQPILDRMKRARHGQQITLLIQREGEPEPRTVVVPLSVEAGRGPEMRLADRLIKQTVRQVLSLRRTDGWWPHYADPRSPSVAVTALAAYALRRTESKLTDEQLAALKSVLDKLVTAQAKDGGLTDPAQVVQHRIYATSLAMLALRGGDPTTVGDDAYGARVDRMQEFLVRSQVQETLPGEARGYDPIDPRYGGWSYHDDFRSRRLRTDLSTARFALLALDDADLPGDAPTWQRAGLFLDLIQNYTIVTPKSDPGWKREAELRDGGFAFTPRLSKAGERRLNDELSIYRSYGTATADGVLSLLALRRIDRRHLRSDSPIRDPRVAAALSWLARNYEVEFTPGFGARSPWRGGLHYYYLAALSQALHRAGVWKVVTPQGAPRVWAADVIKTLGAMRLGGFVNTSGYMHEDSPTIAASFALIALNAARDRLTTAGSGVTLEAGRGTAARARDADLPLPPPSEVRARGEALFTRRCTACHREDGDAIGPSLRDVGDIYLGAAGADAERAKALMKRFVRDPATTPPLIRVKVPEGKQRVRMVAIDEEQVSDADLDTILEYLLHR